MATEWDLYKYGKQGIGAKFDPVGGSGGLQSPKTESDGDYDKYLAESRKNNAIAGGAGVLGSTAGAIQNAVMLKRRKKQGVLDITPTPIKDIIQESGMKARSGQVSNAAARMGRINQGESSFLNKAIQSATSPLQAQQMLVSAKRMSDDQKMQLENQGLQQQQNYEGTNRQFRSKDAEYKALAQNQYNTDIAAYRNAMWSNINNAVNSGAQMAMGLA
jgi:hypothetical protein